ncbi:Tachykinin-like peptides receptor 99D [Schistosoma japonicum]|nr:Tachykinin-like peptides receptor 99D [Schistosoma japonicum]
MNFTDLLYSNELNTTSTSFLYSDNSQDTRIENVFNVTSCIIITFMFALIVIFSIFGNILVIWIIMNNRRMRTITNCFLFNLSAADLLTVFQIIPNVYYVLRNDWIFGIAYCKFSQFFTSFNIAISVFTFIAISSDRYTAIMFPLRPRSKLKTVMFAITAIWLISFAIGLPGLVVATVVPKHLSSLNSLANSTDSLVMLKQIEENSLIQYISNDCVLNWSSEWSEAYDYTLFILMYVLPLIILAATYIPISINLWFHRGLGEVTRAQAQNVRSKRRAVKMLCAVMLIFAICWLPYQLFFIILQLTPTIKSNHRLPVVFICCYWLAMSNSINREIQLSLNNKKQIKTNMLCHILIFRKGFYTAFSCLPYCREYSKKECNSKIKATTIHTLQV